jgi:hypothetical protein
VVDLLLLLLGVFLSSYFPYLIVRFDEKRLSPERLARAWNPASFWIAIVVFGPLSLPVHFTRTRRSLLGFALGLGLAAAAMLAASLPLQLLGWLFGVDPESP